MAHVEAAIMAQDAWTDLCFLSCLHLHDPFRICQELSCKPGSVNLSFLDRFRSRTRIQPSCTYHRNINELPDMLRIFEVAVLRHIDRRMCPVPCIICAIVAIQHVIPGILQELRSPFAFFHVTACLGIRLARQGALAESLGL